MCLQTPRHRLLSSTPFSAKEILSHQAQSAYSVAIFWDLLQARQIRLLPAEMTPLRRCGRKGVFAPLKTKLPAAFVILAALNISSSMSAAPCVPLNSLSQRLQESPDECFHLKTVFEINRARKRGSRCRSRSTPVLKPRTLKKLNDVCRHARERQLSLHCCYWSRQAGRIDVDQDPATRQNIVVLRHPQCEILARPFPSLSFMRGVKRLTPASSSSLEFARPPLYHRLFTPIRPRLSGFIVTYTVRLYRLLTSWIASASFDRSSKKPLMFADHVLLGSRGTRSSTTSPFLNRRSTPLRISEIAFASVLIGSMCQLVS